jgi:cell wall-associated NlpC family hydrolase
VATDRAAIAAEALTWCGTPFRAQASAKGHGCDCKGLVWGVARELGLPEADSFHARIADYDLHRIPVQLLREGMAAVFMPVDPDLVGPGDVLLLQFAGQAQHLAIVTDGGIAGGRAVHAQVKGRKWVKETNLRALLTVFPFDSAWRFSSC